MNQYTITVPLPLPITALQNSKNFFAIIVFVFSLFTSACSTLTVVPYHISSPRIKDKSTVTIVHISDLHSTIYGKTQAVLINAVKKAKPDIIVLTGDIIDDVRPVTGTLLLLDSLDRDIPIYYVTGNHEYMTGDIDGVRAALVSRGVIILSDSFIKKEIRDNSVIIAGIEDPYKKLYEDAFYNQKNAMRTAFEALFSETDYKILLAHRPENIKDYLEYPFDLILAGHTHGGQVRLPFINGLYAPNQGLFPKYGGGVYRFGNKTMIVSRGLSVNKLPRIFNPPELIVITVRGAGETGADSTN
ncbi:MAG: metallophosphoesterase [Spirochaetaceae bacterium]|jgi:predicted MPP superfamily phosphohydrolase|nr:metallophosphoesterase [Spirochaetaceae bacterium]